MKVLFISRKFPPSVGGMEEHAYRLLQYLQKKVTVRSLVLKKSQIHLVWFLPYALFCGIYNAFFCDVVYLADGLLAPIGFVIRLITRKKVCVTIHGLDFTYKNWLYQKVNVRALRSMDGIIAVSGATREEALHYGVPENRVCIIPHGVEAQKYSGNSKSFFWQDIVHKDISRKKILLTVGRLVRRKGVFWFVNHVMPHLPAEYVYCIGGAGKDYDTIQKVIIEHHLEDRVFVLGFVPHDLLCELLHHAHAFIMPNIPVAGDREGFGIVALEASSQGLPVIASRLEGIPEAVHDGKNGFLLPPGNVEQWIQFLPDFVERGLRKREEFKKYTFDTFHWDIITEKYIYELEKLVS